MKWLSLTGAVLAVGLVLLGGCRKNPPPPVPVAKAGAARLHGLEPKTAAFSHDRVATWKREVSEETVKG